MSSSTNFQALAPQKRGVAMHKLAIGAIAAFAMVLVGTTSIAGATNSSQGQQSPAATAQNGYGGNGGNNLDLNLNINGDNNIVNVIVNFFFG